MRGRAAPARRELPNAEPGSGPGALSQENAVKMVDGGHSDVSLAQCCLERKARYCRSEEGVEKPAGHIQSACLLEDTRSPILHLAALRAWPLLESPEQSWKQLTPGPCLQTVRLNLPEMDDILAFSKFSPGDSNMKPRLKSPTGPSK